ncbi:MAG: protease modulator HflC [Treponema sp.]|jgi:membrane protease subunit HflC|nr:protease modulator HflC [Treponema sp.]
MKKTLTTIVVIFVIFIGILIAGPLYVINEGEQAVIVQLGRITNVITDAGLHVKIPFIDEVVRYPKKILAYDSTPGLIPTAERQFIFVDVVARWRIADPKKFYESVKAVSEAYSKLSQIIDSEVPTVVTANPLLESLRNSNIIMERTPDKDALGLALEEGVAGNVSTSGYEPITRGRRQLAEEILTRCSRRMVSEFGIELIDIVIRQISYSNELTSSVYARMVRERNQIAMAYRSEGEGRKVEWLGRKENDKRSILSAAYMQAEIIRGRADAEATRIYADAYNRDAGTRAFYDFWRAIESYRQTMPKFDKTLTTDMEYFRYLYSPR